MFKFCLIYLRLEQKIRCWVVIGSELRNYFVWPILSRVIMVSSDGFRSRKIFHSCCTDVLWRTSLFSVPEFQEFCQLLNWLVWEYVCCHSRLQDRLVKGFLQIWLEGWPPRYLRYINLTVRHDDCILKMISWMFWTIWWSENLFRMTSNENNESVCINNFLWVGLVSYSSFMQWSMTVSSMLKMEEWMFLFCNFEWWHLLRNVGFQFSKPSVKHNWYFV